MWLGRLFFGQKKKRARQVYDFLRNEIVKAHYENLPGMLLEFEGLKISFEDLKSFRYPMYRFGFDTQSRLHMMWDSKKMTEEIGKKKAGGEVESGDEIAQSTTREVLQDTGQAGV